MYQLQKGNITAGPFDGMDMKIPNRLSDIFNRLRSHSLVGKFL